MRSLLSVALAAALVVGASPARSETSCAGNADALGVSRVVEIDTSTGPLFGDMSAYAKEASFLGPKEVVLTFDDGPMPAVTKPILDTLDKFCTKATFFSVGRMAIAYPAMTKEVLARGHTLGTHTWSHPFNLKHSSVDRARDEIERGFSAVALAAGQPIAPFFRFPGLSDSNPMLALLQSRGVASFTVDVVSNDSYIGDPGRLTDRTIKQTIARNGGILLFHDIKHSTAKALPAILKQLKDNGFKVVHMRPKTTYTPVADYDAQLTAMLAKMNPPKPATASAGATAAPSAAGDGGDTKHALIPFTAAVAPEVAALSDKMAEGDAPPVTQIAPTAKARGPVGGQDGARQRQEVAVNHDDPTATPVPVKGKDLPARHKRAKRPPPTEPGDFRFFD